MSGNEFIGGGRSTSPVTPPTEGEWGELLDDTRLYKSREAADEERKELDDSAVTYLRRRAKSDLFFLCTAILGYELLSIDLHGHYCNWLERTRGERYRMSLKPRGHYKTTTNTISDSIQMALPNDAGVQEYPYTLGPNIKILLSHENRESASRFLFEITAAFAHNPLMMALFPELVPTKRLQRMNKWELDLPRDINWKEPTFDTIGVAGAAQGRHFHHLKLDDLVGEDARDSVTVMGRTNDWFDNVNSLLTRIKFDGWDLTGTRWSDSDTYGHALKKFGMRFDKSFVTVYSESELDRINEGLLAVYARGALESGVPIFPEEFPLEDLNVIRKNPVVWAAQYANNPRESGLTEFRTPWLKFYNAGPQGRITIFTGDESRNIYPRELDICIFADPSMGETERSDESGIIVTGTDKRLNIFVLETIKERLIPPEFVAKLFELYTKYYPRLVSIEDVNFSGTFKYWMAEKQRETHQHMNIVPYKPGSKKSKIARVRGLTNYFAAGQIYIQEGMHELRDEFEAFPLDPKNMHLLDALAHGPQLWVPGLGEEQYDQYAEVVDSLSQHRSKVTGY